MVIRGGTIINISGNTPVDDPEYRYKMPAVFGKIEGSGNGIKTCIPNITDVALSLHRSPGEVTKFFGTELGAQARYTADTDRAIVNGAHTDATLQELIHRYIEKFVLCPNCGLPETEYKIKNADGSIYHKCAACGAKEMVDMSHKLCNFILAENKKVKKEKAGNSSSKKDEKKKKDKKKDKDNGSDDDKKKKKDKDKKKDKKSKKKDKDGKDEAENGKDYINDALFGKKQDDGLDINDDDDSDDVSDEANGAGGGGGGVDDEGALDLAVEATRKYIADKGTVAASSPKELVELVTNQQMASALKAQDKVAILALACITPATFFKDKEIATFAPTFLLLTNGNRIMERHLIAALEVLCITKTKNFPVMLKQFYDEDVLQEEVILEWADDGRSEYTSSKVDEEVRAMLRAEAEPVVAWLQEEDSDDDDDENDSAEED